MRDRGFEVKRMPEPWWTPAASWDWLWHQGCWEVIVSDYKTLWLYPQRIRGYSEEWLQRKKTCLCYTWQTPASLVNASDSAWILIVPLNIIQFSLEVWTVEDYIGQVMKKIYFFTFNSHLPVEKFGATSLCHMENPF